METPAETIYRFGPFEVNAASGELRKQGKRVKLQEQPLRLLVILLENPGQVVTRADIQARIWDGNTFVDFDSGLRVAVRKLRDALGDDADNPRYIETIPKRGYRFLEPAVRSEERTTLSAPAEASPVATGSDARRKASRPWIYAVLFVSMVAAGFGAFRYYSRSKSVLSDKDTVVLADFVNSTGDPVFDETLRQGLTVQLEQSPYLALVSEGRIQHTLRLMGQPSGARLTPELAREICERTGSAAVLEGSIATLGSQYVLGLRAKSCRTGDVLAEEQVQAARKEDVLKALGEMASTFRTRLGESLATVEKHSTPLAEATTPSLDGLKAYSAGWKADYSKGEAAAIPFFKQAMEADPNFAMAYAALGLMYGATGESALSAENTRKAYELRERASDQERFFISASYEGRVTGNLEKAQQVCETWAQEYPAEPVPHGFLSGFIYPVFGKYEQTVAEARKASAIDPDFAVGYLNLAYGYVYQNRMAEAEAAMKQAEERKVELPYFAVLRYDIAFLKADKVEMERQASSARSMPGAEDWIADHEAFAAAYSGQMQQAGVLARRAIDLAQQAGQNERAALFEAGMALWEGFAGNPGAARSSALAALELSKDREVEYGAAFALALAGESAHAQALADDLEKRFPEDTSVRFSYLPVLRALLALNDGDAARALELLQAAGPYELGVQRSSIHGNFGALYPVYVRGLAYLALHQGAEAATEFRKIIDHPGVVISDPAGAMARLQLARAYAMQGDAAKAKSKAKAAYQDFLGLWQNADAEVPVYQQVKAEFERLR